MWSQAHHGFGQHWQHTKWPQIPPTLSLPLCRDRVGGIGFGPWGRRRGAASRGCRARGRRGLSLSPRSDLAMCRSQEPCRPVTPANGLPPAGHEGILAHSAASPSADWPDTGAGPAGASQPSSEEKHCPAKVLNDEPIVSKRGLCFATQVWVRLFSSKSSPPEPVSKCHLL